MRQQAIIWANVDLDQYRHIVSLGHIEGFHSISLHCFDLGFPLHRTDSANLLIVVHGLVAIFTPRKHRMTYYVIVWFSIGRRHLTHCQQHYVFLSENHSAYSVYTCAPICYKVLIEIICLTEENCDLFIIIIVINWWRSVDRFWGLGVNHKNMPFAVTQFTENLVNAIVYNDIIWTTCKIQIPRWFFIGNYTTVYSSHI